MSKGATFLKQKPTRLYRGQPAESLIISQSDIPLLVEIRARQRTFNGAYARTALQNLCYSLTILRFFDTQFYPISLLFAMQGILLYIISYFRDRHSRHDFADEDEEDLKVYENVGAVPRGGLHHNSSNTRLKTHGAIPDYTGLNPQPKTAASSLNRSISSAMDMNATSPLLRHPYSYPTKEAKSHNSAKTAFKTSPATGKRIYGRPFVTAGWIIIAVSLVVLSMELALIGQIMSL